METDKKKKKKKKIDPILRFAFCPKHQEVGIITKTENLDNNPFTPTQQPKKPGMSNPSMATKPSWEFGIPHFLDCSKKPNS